MTAAEAKKDYYALLGVPEDASSEEIDRGYRSRARELHPDRGGSEEEMKLINEAHDILGDEAMRIEYDRQRRPAPQAIPYVSSAAFDPQAASNMGTLEIRVADPDYFGLAVGAAFCIGLGLAFLVLIEMQYVFFLWPLRFLTIGVILIGLMMGHAALRMKRKLPNQAVASRGRVVIQEVAFWVGALGLTTMVYLLLYAR